MPWDAFQTEKLLKNLETLSKEESFFNNSSPIARGIITCKTKGFRKNFNGPQVVVALTDGSDNYVRPERERNKARVPPELQLSNDSIRISTWSSFASWMPRIRDTPTPFTSLAA